MSAGRRPKSCKACFNSKQKCEGVVWQGEQNKAWDGPLALQGDLAGIRNEIRELKEVMKKGVKAITALARVVDTGLW